VSISGYILLEKESVKLASMVAINGTSQVDCYRIDVHIGIQYSTKWVFVGAGDRPATRSRQRRDNLDEPVINNANIL
jgi:hypothetical protein